MNKYLIILLFLGFKISFNSRKPQLLRIRTNTSIKLGIVFLIKSMMIKSLMRYLLIETPASIINPFYLEETLSTRNRYCLQDSWIVIDFVWNNSCRLEKVYCYLKLYFRRDEEHLNDFFKISYSWFSSFLLHSTELAYH